ncbi:uncharacterized protein LOC8285641 [Ricinus communis]|uniref:uncharacterized protein LOC8285641 n=1 Tax=Ricinus communis TaxID=3988 RepID=UPI00077275A3|nr:uncharacterized protein LOC8285641 [Ricinus communis]|eukprot:XP_025014163.1 uncharacterized protein LOC8285641 [Ricinus communis]
MATNPDEDKWEHSDSPEEEEEALSLCDLPVNLIEEEIQSRKEEEACRPETEIIQEDFNFGKWDDSEMCAADDIFFDGQILPFRLSVSSESGIGPNNCCKQDSLNRNRCLSRSESIDHGSTAGFTSFSSRSSSSRSQLSSTSTNSSSVNTTSSRISKPRFQNQFHAHPSPKPQIRLSNNSLGNAATNKSRKSSTVWDIFRLGLVRAPEIELQDLKTRTSVSRNSSSSSSNSNSNIKVSGNSSSSEGKKMEKQNQKQRKQSFSEKRSSGSLLSGCSCTVSAVKPVPLNIIIIKSSSSSTGKNSAKDKSQEILESTTKEKKVQVKNNKKKIVEKQQQKPQGKQTMSRHRTFEWIKELSSHATFLDHEEGRLDS